MYGLSPDNLENNGDLSSSATKFLDEDSLARKFGSSKELVISIVEALQGKSNPKTSLTDFIEAAQMVGHCHYEHQTNWGKTLGCLYDSVAEDMNTSIGIHLRGWSSSYICPDPPAFLGSTPSVGFEAIVQQRRWGTGAIEVLFNKQSPLRGMFSSKIRFRQRLAYLWVLMCLRSIPELFYCLLPAYCLLRNTALYPKGPCLAITVTIVAMHCLYTLWQFTNNGFSVRSWYVSQSLWRILATCGWLFSIHDILLKLLGISNVGFVVAKKTTPKTMPISGYEPIQRQDDGPNSCYVHKFEFDNSCHFVPGTFIMLVNMAALASNFVGLQRSSCHHEGGRSGLAENCACILVILLFLPFLKGLFAKGKYGIPLSTLSKAALLAMIFVVFAVGY
ncbi:cellulose synthase-like protein B5 [Brassica napus]|uniref:cellulose synthase-like protein B5 n=1 Tax=Brassica napus TaxID=3708 RepID=UPI002078A087|nr:cellulose synthase-like protein B5 [Brassica napus]